MRELTEDIGGLILSTIEDLPDVEPLPSNHSIVEYSFLILTMLYLYLDVILYPMVR